MIEIVHPDDDSCPDVDAHYSEHETDEKDDGCGNNHMRKHLTHPDQSALLNPLKANSAKPN
ncbi:hypothetical protein [Saliphagus sp. LR7]|uniref:hypothetical protein n=1 Tax=Saliphagus sp. LR7 TaxID=2282654 RepID=UPI0018E51F19|nr:hypothetical protein [Saliphagus sp. LR7]